MSEYLRLMKLHSNNLELVGSPVSIRALVSQVLLGLDENYNLVVATLKGKEDVTWLEMHTTRNLTLPTSTILGIS